MDVRIRQQLERRLRLLLQGRCSVECEYSSSVGKLAGLYLVYELTPRDHRVFLVGIVYCSSRLLRGRSSYTTTIFRIYRNYCHDSSLVRSPRKRRKVENEDRQGQVQHADHIPTLASNHPSVILSLWRLLQPMTSPASSWSVARGIRGGQRGRNALHFLPTRIKPTQRNTFTQLTP